MDTSVVIDLEPGGLLELAATTARSDMLVHEREQEVRRGPERGQDLLGDVVAPDPEPPPWSAGMTGRRDGPPGDCRGAVRVVRGLRYPCVVGSCPQM